MNNIFVYVGKVNDFKYNTTLPQYQLEQINKITNIDLINQKKAVYGLLFKVIKDNYLINDDFKHITISSTGKPISDKYCFSLSHTKELIAVAISSNNIGVDIEKIDKNKNHQNIKKIIMHDDENDLNINNIEDLIKLWVKKESIFKFLGQNKIFIPNKINTKAYNTKIKKLKLNDDNYCLSVCSNDLTNIKLVFLK